MRNAAKTKKASLLCCLFFAFWLVLGLCTAPQYGIPWDEFSEMDILRMNLWEYTLRLGGDDAPFARWAQEAPQTLLDAPLPISKSAERDHGECAYYPLAGVMMEESVSAARLSALWHGYTWLLFWLGGLSLYFVCRHLGLSQGMACLGVTLMMLSPRFFAEGHYNNKDIVLMTLVLLTLWQGLRLGKKPTLGAGACFALAGALAANTKIIGFFLWGLCGLFAVIRLAAEKRLHPKVWGIGLFSMALFFLCYALLTPALWADPVGFARYVLENAAGFSRWQGDVLFRGVVFATATQPLPWYYLPYMMLISTPLWVGFLFALGQGAALWHGLKDPLRKGSPLLLCTLLWLIPVAFALLSSVVVYNGWRHFYFLYGPMVALAAYGLSWLWELVRAKGWQRRALAALLALCMGLTGVGMALNHPYQYVYYNPLTALRDPGFLERDYWNVSVKNALDVLQASPALAEAGSPPSVSGVDLFSHQGVADAMRAIPYPLVLTDWAANTADFLLVNHTYQPISRWQPRPGMVPVAQIQAYGVPLVTIYRNGEEGANP